MQLHNRFVRYPVLSLWHAPVRRAAALTASIVMLAMAGCGSLPDSGPTARQLLDGATSEANTLGFKVVDIDAAVSRELEQPGADPMRTLPFAKPAGERSGTLPRVDAIGPGDTLSITVFEIGAALFSASPGLPPLPGGGVGGAGGEAPTAAGENLPPIVVAADGTIDVPYVGRLVVAGRTPSELEAMVRAGLRRKSQDPQVVVSVRENVANTVVVMGDVRKPGRLPLTLAHERLLDMIALAGGINSDNESVMQDEVVRLTRGARSAQLPLAALHADSPDNVPMRPDDRVEVIHQPRTYTVMGATGKVSQQPFSAAHLSLAEAIARVGGPSDQQADPTAVFLFRDSAQHAAAGDALADPDVHRPAQPVIYRLDLMNPQNYFLAQRFAMRDKDLVYIANARSNGIAKFLSMVNLVFQPFYTGRLVTEH